jgi:hypothetical protein
MMTTAHQECWCQWVNGPLMAWTVNNHIVETEVGTQDIPLTSADTSRAGDGNRTRMTSLEGWSSAIELRPQQPPRPVKVRSGRHP